MRKVFSWPIAVAICAAAAPALWGHANPLPAPKPPFRVQGATLLDAARIPFLLYGAVLPGLRYAGGTEVEDAAIAALRPLTFRVLRQRWNLNAVRLPVSASIFAQQGPDYVERIAAVVEMAAAEELVANLVVVDETPLPGNRVAAFWMALASRLRDQSRVVFSLYARPAVPEGDVRAAWIGWRNGTDSSVGMQQLVDAIRSVGAEQVVSAAGFDGDMAFRGFTEDLLLRDNNVIYEVTPGLGWTDAERDTRFGFLAGLAPLYIAEWGAPVAEVCGESSLQTAEDLTAAVYQMLAYIGLRSLSWSVGEFRAGGLVEDYETLTASDLRSDWKCGEPGIGRLILLWQTGDLFGFGSIAADQIASAAGGPSGPLAPGQIVNLYGQLVGPETEVQGGPDESGKLPLLLGETQILLDGEPVPVLTTSYFFVKIQVPYEVAFKQKVKVQALYRGVPSNTVELDVTDYSPGLFTRFGTIADVAALNDDGSQNSPNAAAAAGTVVRMRATGLGPLTPAAETGKVATQPVRKPLSGVRATIGGLAAEVVQVQEVLGEVGVMEVMVRVPAPAVSGVRAVPVVLEVGGKRSWSEVRIWVR